MSSSLDQIQALLEGKDDGGKAGDEEKASTLRLKKDAGEAGGDKSAGAEPRGRRENGPDRNGGGGEGDRGDSGTDTSGSGDRGEAAEGRAPEGDAEGRAAKSRWKDLEADATLRDFSKAVDIPATRLYELHVPLGDGTGRTMSVENLKAGYLASEAGELDSQRHEFASQQAQFEQRAIEAENALLHSRREVQTILNMVGSHLPLEVMKGLQNEAQAAQQREAGLLLDAMPQFKDRTVYHAWQDDAHKALAPFGFKRAEVENLADHRVYRVVDAFVRLQARVKALEDVTADPPKPPKSVRAQKRQTTSKARDAEAKAKRTGSRQDQITAVEALLKS